MPVTDAKVEPFRLTTEELHSPLWKKLKDHAESRVDKFRRKNDKDKDLVATAKLRGRIAEASYFAALENPAQQIEADDSE